MDQFPGLKKSEEEKKKYWAGNLETKAGIRRIEQKGVAT